MSAAVIGLCGRAGSGKSTAATALEGEGYYRRSFAEPLKEMARRIWDLSAHQVYGPQAIKEAVDPRYGRSPRELLQFLGTDVCRDILGPDVWVEAALRACAEDERTVFDDVRFENEADAIRSRGGVVIRLVTVGDGASRDAGTHASERVELVPCDHTLAAPMMGAGRFQRYVLSQLYQWGVI